MKTRNNHQEGVEEKTIQDQMEEGMINPKFNVSIVKKMVIIHRSVEALTILKKKPITLKKKTRSTLCCWCPNEKKMKRRICGILTMRQVTICAEIEKSLWRLTNP